MASSNIMINKAMTARKSVSFHGFSDNMVSGYTGPDFVTKEKSGGWFGVGRGLSVAGCRFLGGCGLFLGSCRTIGRPQPTTHDPQPTTHLRRLFLARVPATVIVTSVAELEKIPCRSTGFGRTPGAANKSK